LTVVFGLASAIGADGAFAFDRSLLGPDICGPVNPPKWGGDYRRASAENKVLVEGAHFTRDVENLKGYYNRVRGTRSPPGADIQYTLGIWPNHHRALWAMVRLGERDKTDQPKGAWYPVECYFERAIRFIPDDLLVRVIYANYLIKQGLHKEAAVQVDIADKAGDDQTANFYYNLGLALFDLKQYDRAVVRAKQAYDLGFPLPGLKDKLAKVGKWEP
jgi:tetratricopeptide (TPR) repeat protein